MLVDKVVETRTKMKGEMGKISRQVTREDLLVEIGTKGELGKSSRQVTREDPLVESVTEAQVFKQRRDCKVPQVASHVQNILPPATKLSSKFGQYVCRPAKLLEHICQQFQPYGFAATAEDSCRLPTSISFLGEEERKHQFQKGRIHAHQALARIRSPCTLRVNHALRVRV